MIAKVYMSSKQKEKLVSLTNRRDNYLGVGIYLMYTEAPELAYFIGFQQIGRMQEFGKPEYNDRLVGLVNAFFRERAGMEKQQYGAIGIGIRGRAYRNKFQFGDAPKELVRFLKLVGKKLNTTDYLYMLTTLTDMKIARLVLEGRNLDPIVLDEQPMIISAAEKDWTDYFEEELKKLKKPAEGTTLLIE
jgi:hypothetical protein